MKNEKLYHETVDILANAYMNNTLVHGTCAACAVGNIIAARQGMQVIKNSETTFMWAKATIEEGITLGSPKWQSVFVTKTKETSGRGRILRAHLDLNNYYGMAKKQIDATGYEPIQLAYMEKRFEQANSPFNDFVT